MSVASSIRTLIVLIGIILTSSVPLVNPQPTQTSLIIGVPSEPQWRKYTIEATLKDENDNPLEKLDIDFYVCGSTKIGAAKTNSTGVASLEYAPFESSLKYPPRTVTYKVNAVFSGTTNYAPSSSEDIYIDFIFRDIDVFLDYGSYIVGGILAVAIIGVAGFILFHRRKRIFTMPHHRPCLARSVLPDLEAKA